MLHSPGQFITLHKLRRNCVALAVALGANSLLFYALAWARTRPVPVIPQEKDAPFFLTRIASPEQAEDKLGDLP